MDETTKLIEVEITVSEGGTWLKLQVTSETLFAWLNIRYGKPELENMVRIYTVKFPAIGGVMIRDFAAETWRAE